MHELHTSTNNEKEIKLFLIVHSSEHQGYSMRALIRKLCFKNGTLVGATRASLSGIQD